MDHARAIQIINANRPELIVEDAGNHLNIRKVAGGPCHSIMVPQPVEGMEITEEQESETLRRAVMDALRMLPDA